MMVTHEDIKELKRVFDERYVLIGNCDKTQKKVNDKFAKDDKRLDLLNLKMTASLWLVGIIASGIIALVLKVYIGG
ncbi:MAG: hypothetical protein IKZ35_04105 [Clostridia bacterium]|nr:hypothetical protein [Oscillospiraceae bacterium]MBR4893146.1 hypothetical protein [Clostridia bacterium]